MAPKAAIKKEQIKMQSAGLLFTALIDKKKYTLKVEDKKEITSLKKLIESFNTLNSEAKKAKLIALLTPKQEKAKQEVLVLKKQVKNKEKTVQAQITELSGTVATLVKAVEGLLGKKEEPKQAEVAKVVELARDYRYKGYVNPVTGRTWDGEKYV